MLYDNPTRARTSRLSAAFFVLGVVMVFGSGVYYYLGEGRWDLFQCVYMTLITISTVGFAETLPGMAEVPAARLFTMLLVVIGSGTLLYVGSNLTAIFVEGDLRGILQRRRMQKRIDNLSDHIVVCGVGNTGSHVVEELQLSGTRYVVVDRDETRIKEVLGRRAPSEMLYVVGDASDDSTLHQAGVARARGVVTALHEDKDNLYVTITARALNPDTRIVAKAVESEAEPKLRRAGADAIVSPYMIGGHRMASEMIRPTAMEFIDRMFRDRDLQLRIEEVEIPEGSPLHRRSLSSSGIRDAGALVIALRQRDGHWVYNPEPKTELGAGMTLMVMAQADGVDRVRKRVVR